MKNSSYSKLRFKIGRIAKRAYWRMMQERKAHHQIVFIVGCQRSGTTMLRRLFERDYRARTFEEFSAITRDEGRGIRLRPFEEVRAIFEATPEPLIIAKPLVESQNILRLLAEFDGSCAIWTYRNVFDVVNSNLNKFASQIETCRIMASGNHDDWRSEVIPEVVKNLLAEHYHPAMSREDAAALFWYARNALFFDLRLQDHQSVYLWSYDAFVQNPELESLYHWLRLETPKHLRLEDVSERSLGLGKDVNLTPAIRDACIQLQQELDEAQAATC